MSNDIVTNRSTLKEFLASIATISGDLSNITAPPFVLAENSTVEIPQYWADHPYLFVAPAAEQDPKKRALLVLKWFVGSLRNQQYAGRRVEEGVKKPLNAFLGELFFGNWKDTELGETQLVSEQVSHHPPITACYLWNEKHGVRAEGFTQQEITFNGSVSIKQKGYAIMHIDKYDEDYLIPVPNVKVKGIISGMPYPELQGDYSLISSNGYISHVKFDGKGIFGTGTKNGFSARLYHSDQREQDLYTLKGAWNGSSIIVDGESGAKIETFDVEKLQSVKIKALDLSQQDPWESRRAWGNVISALRRGDMRGTTNAKSRIEQGQREMRKEEETLGKPWRSLFFKTVRQDPVFEELSLHDPGSYTVDRKGGVWKVDSEAIKNTQKPYHGELLPTNGKAGRVQPQELKDGQKRKDQQQTPPSAVATLDVHADSSDPQRSPIVEDFSDNLSKETAGTRVENQINQVKVGGGLDVSTTSGAVTMQGDPTDAQVEAFLRARHSNAR